MGAAVSICAHHSTVTSMTEFWYTALLIALAALPIAFVGIAFLHAARAPQWVWAMSGRTQIIWLAGLLVGAGVIFAGVPAAAYYYWKIRPVLDRIERGDFVDMMTGEDTAFGSS